jgi:tetratricopeptide (TPR) repeat protein
MKGSSSKPLLSAALVVRDESEHLDGCLASLAGVVDEIVVVDTGSVDNSVTVARSFGAHVYELPWADDFSQSRNAGLAKVTGQWVLYIDADERLRPTSRTDIEALLEAAEEVAFRVWLRPFVGATPCREYRLWRNDTRIRFEGVIHEKVVPAIKAVAASDARPIGLCELELDHLGYEGDQSAKHRRNLPLLRAQLAHEPGNLFNWRHLAAVLAGTGELTGAEQALDRAVAVVRSSPVAVPGGSLAYADLIRFHQKRGGAGDLMVEALARYPDDPLLLWMQALIELDRGQPERALAALDRLGAVDRTKLDDTISYEEGLFGVMRQEARGLCLFRLGRFADAAVAYGEAERSQPANDQHRLKRLMAEHLASTRSGIPTAAA